MKLISCEKLEKSMVELQFSIDAETFKSAVNAAFKREGKKSVSYTHLTLPTIA